MSPTTLFDLSCRVGGAAAGTTASCVTINSNDVIIDNAWLWRADHGTGVGWNVNVANNGLIVNGANVAYGLFVEHFQRYQTMWNGEGGKVYFYPSEIPYDVPSQGSSAHLDPRDRTVCVTPPRDHGGRLRSIAARGVALRVGSALA